MRKRRVALWAVCGFAVIVPMTFGDLPAPSMLSEAQPPSDAEWFAYYYYKQARAVGAIPSHKCAKPACVGPLELWQEVTYYPCEAGCPCKPSHPSYSGCYGIRHPMPYYIPNPTLSVEIPGCATGRCRQQSLRDPTNRVDVTIGVWE